MEALVLHTCNVLVRSVFKLWLSDRRNQHDRTRPLSELLNLRLTDDFQRRKFSREMEAMTDAVAQRLLPLCRQEFAGLDEADRNAALAEVVKAFENADLSDDALFAVDVDAAKLARQLRRSLPNAAQTAGLGEAASSFYDIVLDECCVCYIQLIVHLAPFSARASAELLGRLSSLTDQVAQALQRLPARTLLAPSGMAFDGDFQNRYLQFVSEAFDYTELFGVDVQRFRLRTTLSVAYISLSVSANLQRPAFRDRLNDSEWSRSGVPSVGTMRVEQALASSARMIILGDAGSGKSTLLRWLAINAARGTFNDDLKKFNNFMPFLIKLRSYAGRRLPKPEEFLDEYASPLAALMPKGFAHRQLEAGRSLLLIDGVDELANRERNGVRDWLESLMLAFPGNQMIVTSRPAGAPASLVRSGGFGIAYLQRMSGNDIQALIHQWHDAARDAGRLPCDEQELPRYEGSLLSRLDGNPHLRMLATSPLLCAMLCALNLDRRSYLPRDRIELYRTALVLLLDRRDAERQIPSALTFDVSSRDKRQLLRQLAWRMSINGRSELARAEAARRLRDKLASMPQIKYSPDEMLDYFVGRSGILREPTADRIDFVHRTFQEFLTAEEATDEGDVGLLIQHAHLDQWRNVVVMAAGLGNAPIRNELMQSLLDRADAEPQHRRRLQLLAASCTEAAPSLTPQITDRLDECLTQLLPPRNSSEARSLASVGESLLPRLMLNPAEISEAAGVASIRTAALINGADTWQVLELFAHDPRPRIQKELISAWQYFDPHEYASRILTNAPLLNGHLTIRNKTLLPSVAQLRQLTALRVDLDGVSDLDWLPGLPCLQDLSFSGVFDGLALLLPHQKLNSLLVSSRQPVNPEPLKELPNLTKLFFYTSNIPSLDSFRPISGLMSLGLSGMQNILDLEALVDLVKLEQLAIYNYPAEIDLTAIRDLPMLSRLDIGRPGDSPGTESSANVGRVVRCIAELAPTLAELGFLEMDLTDHIGEITQLAHLKRLSLRFCEVVDLTPLADMTSLTHLQIAGPGIPDYLRQIKKLPQIRDLDILGGEDNLPVLDLSPLGSRQLNVHIYRHRHRIIGANKRVKVKWLDE